MPKTKKTFSRAHQTTSKTRPTSLSLSSFTSKSDPTAAHKARHALKKGRKQDGGGKERDREMMEQLNKGGDVGYKGREMFLAGLTKTAPEGEKIDASVSAGGGVGGGTMNEARRQRMGAGGAGTDELVSSLGGMRTK